MAFTEEMHTAEHRYQDAAEELSQMCIRSTGIQSTLGRGSWCRTQDSVAQLKSLEGSTLQTYAGLDQRVVAVRNPFIQSHNVLGNPHNSELSHPSQVENLKQSGAVIVSELHSANSTNKCRPRLISLANTSFSEVPAHYSSSPGGRHLPKRELHIPTVIHGDCHPLETTEPVFRHGSLRVPIDKIVVSNVQSSPSPQLCASTCKTHGELDSQMVFKISIQLDKNPAYQSKTIVFPPSRECSKPAGCKFPAVSMPTFIPTITAHMVQPFESLDEVPVADTGDEFLPDIQCRKNTKGIQTNTKGTSIQCTSAQHSEVYNIDFPRRYRSYMAFSIVMCLICCCCNPLVTLLCVCPAIIGSCVSCSTRSYRVSRRAGKLALCCNVTALITGAAKVSCILGAVCLPLIVVSFVAAVGVAIGSTAVSGDAIKDVIVGYFHRMAEMVQSSESSNSIQQVDYY